MISVIFIIYTKTYKLRHYSVAMHPSDEESDKDKAQNTRNALVSTKHSDFIVKEVPCDNQQMVINLDDDDDDENEIPCECVNSCRGHYARKKKNEDYSDYEEEEALFERGEVLECTEPKGKMCVEYKRKVDHTKKNNVNHTDDKDPENPLGPNTSFINIPPKPGQNNIACECGAVDCSCKKSQNKNEPCKPPVLNEKSWACKHVHPCGSKEPVWSCKPIQPGQPIEDREPIWSCIPIQPGDDPNEKKWSCQLIQPCGTTKPNKECQICDSAGPPPQPVMPAQSCYPYKIRKKQKDGQCPKNLYTYEIIRNLPYDEDCKCGQKTDAQEVYSTRSDANESTIASTKGSVEKRPRHSIPFIPIPRKSIALGNSNNNNETSNLNRRQSNATHASYEKKFSSKRKSIGGLSSISEGEYGKCDCFPDLNCECPVTGEYKAISRDEFVEVTKPKTSYLDNPCMQEYFAPCETGEQPAGDPRLPSSMPTYGPFSDQDLPFCMDSKGQRITFKGMPNVCAPPLIEPCCPCPKPDPDPDHPSYLSTKLNVTDLMKQLITFHYNRTLMNQYYGRLLTDDTDMPCTTCCSIIEEAAGCVGECCKCPKPEPPPCCACKTNIREKKSSTTIDKKSSMSVDKKSSMTLDKKLSMTFDKKKYCTCEKMSANVNCLEEFENKYGALIDEVNRVINSKNISNQPSFNRQVYSYNVAVSNNIKYKDEHSNYEKPVLSDLNHKSKSNKEIKAVKRFFNFSRKKDETPPFPEQQSKRKTIREFLMGIKKDIARKKSLAQKQEEDEN